MESTLKSLLNRDLRLPSIPAVAQQLLALASSPDCNSEDLAGVLSSDPAIASTVLRHVNSSVYAPLEKIVSIHRAVVTLGFDAVTNIALMFSLVDSRPGYSNTSLDLSCFWQRSLLCAIAAKSLGKEAGEPRLESLFLAGLLQDIGMLALDRANPIFYEGIDYQQLNHAQAIEFEIKQLKVDHANFGSWLLTKWGLPPLISAAVASSHETEFAGERSDDFRFNCCVALSGAVADLFLNQDQSEDQAERVAKVLQQALKVEREGFDALMQRMHDELDTLSWVLDKLVEGPNEVYAMRVQAQRLLNKRLGVPAVGLNRYRSLQQSAFLSDAHDGQDLLKPEDFEKHYVDKLGAANEGSVHIALLRVDNLRAIETEHGEKSASQLLRFIGRNILDEVRRTDLVTRISDVFVIALSDTIEDGTRVAMHRLLELLRGSRYKVGKQQVVELQLEVGIAVSVPRRSVSLESSMNIALDALDKAGRYDIVSYVTEEAGTTIARH